jgi:hypothetical protein
VEYGEERPWLVTMFKFHHSSPTSSFGESLCQRGTFTSSKNLDESNLNHCPRTKILGTLECSGVRNNCPAIVDPGWAVTYLIVNIALPDCVEARSYLLQVSPTVTARYAVLRMEACPPSTPYGAELATSM